MRNVRALFGLTVCAAAFGCGGGADQSGRGAQSPSQATAETPPSETTAEPTPSTTGEPEMGSSTTVSPGQTTPGQPGHQGAPAPTTRPQLSSNDLLTGTFACLLGPVGPGETGMGTPSYGSSSGPSYGSSSGSSSSYGTSSGSYGSPGSSGQGSMGTGSSGQGSMGTGSSGQGSMGTGSSGQGSMGTGSSGQGSMGTPSGSSGSTMPGTAMPGTSGMSATDAAAEQCMIVAQTAGVAPTSLATGDSTAIDSVRRTLDARLSAEGASQDASNMMLVFFDKGVAAAKEAQAAESAVQARGASPQSGTSDSAHGAGGGPMSTSGGTSSTHTGTSSTHAGSQGQSTPKQDTSKQTASMHGGDEIRAHRALGDLYQFGRSQGTTDTGAAAQALAWIIAVDRFDSVRDVPVQQKALAAEPLFAVILNTPAPASAGTSASAWNEYLSTTAHSVASMAGGGATHAVGGGPSTTDEKANMQIIARSAEDHLQVIGQQLPPSSPLRAQVDQSIAELRKIESQAQPSSTTHGTQPKQTTPKKQPSNQHNQKQQNP